jgi:hypothetical protein
MSSSSQIGSLKRKRSISESREPTKSDPEYIPSQTLKFNDLSTRGKEKAVQKVTQRLLAYPTPVILKSAQHVMSKKEEKATSLILKEIQKQPNSSPKILFKMKDVETGGKPYCLNKALALLLEIGLLLHIHAPATTRTSKWMQNVSIVS